MSTSAQAWTPASAQGGDMNSHPVSVPAPRPTPDRTVSTGQTVVMLTLGGLEVVVCLLTGALLGLSAIGVAMCSDAGSAAYCHAVDTGLQQTAFLTAATFVAAVLTMALCRCRARWAQLSTVTGVLLMVGLIVRALAFYQLTSQPLS